MLALAMVFMVLYTDTYRRPDFLRHQPLPFYFLQQPVLLHFLQHPVLLHFLQHLDPLFQNGRRDATS